MRIKLYFSILFLLNSCLASSMEKSASAMPSSDQIERLNQDVRDKQQRLDEWKSYVDERHTPDECLPQIHPWMPQAIWVDVRKDLQDRNDKLKAQVSCAQENLNIAELKLQAALDSKPDNCFHSSGRNGWHWG